MKKSYSILEISELAGVSPATVSRAFNGTGYVKDEIKEKIFKIAQENGYKPKKYKKRLDNPSRDLLIGMVVPDMENPFFHKIIRAITSVFEQNNVEIIICDINESPQKEIRSLNLLKQLNVSGIIISPASESADYNCGFLKELYEKGMPIIVLDRDIRGIGLSGVFQNSYEGAYSAVKTLINAGHEKIAIVAGPITSKPGLDRMVGYMDALKDSNIDVQQEYILYGDFKEESGYVLTKKLLEEHPEITAVFASNNLMSIGALKAIKDANMKIPQDIAFISYGSLKPFYTEKNISELVEPSELMGYECASLMLEKMKQGKKKSYHVAKRVSFDTRLNLRGSEIFPINRIK